MARFNSLRSRLLLVMALAFALGVGGTATYLLGLDGDVRAYVLAEQVDMLLASSPMAASGADLGQLPTHLSQSDWRYALYTADGKLLTSHPQDQPPVPFLAPGRQPPDGWTATVAQTVGGNRILVTHRNDGPDCDAPCRTYRSKTANAPIIIATMIAISLAAMVGLAGWMLDPIHQATVTAAAVGKNNPDHRIALRKLPREILPLAIVANNALDRLADSQAAELRFTADIAHELRTPLAVLDLRLQKARRSDVPDWAEIARDMDQMRHLVDQLLTLARADQEVTIPAYAGPVAIARVIREAVADILPVYEASDRQVTLDLSEGLMLSDGKGQLRQALRNLLENAVKHGQGTVQVKLRKVNAATAAIEVIDEGAPIPPSTGELLFDRFRKGRQQTTGPGLGLAIVRRLLQNLGGNARIGSGPTFSVLLIVPLVSQRGSGAG